MNWNNLIRDAVNNADLPESDILNIGEAIALKEIGSGDIYELIAITYAYGYIRGRGSEQALQQQFRQLKRKCSGSKRTGTRLDENGYIMQEVL